MRGRRGPSLIQEAAAKAEGEDAQRSLDDVVLSCRDFRSGRFLFFQGMFRSVTSGTALWIK